MQYIVLTIDIVVYTIMQVIDQQGEDNGKRGISQGRNIYLYIIYIYMNMNIYLITDARVHIEYIIYISTYIYIYVYI